MLDHGVSLTPSQGLEVGLSSARALAFAHRRGLLHRAVKPANLLFDDRGRLHLADFGIARALAEASRTEPSGSLAAAARYSSPESALGRRLDGAADVYALALVVVEAVAGRVPAVGDTTAATLAMRTGGDVMLDPDAAAAVGPLRGPLERALRLDPSDRPDAEELEIALLATAELLPRPEALPLVPIRVPDPSEPSAAVSSERDAEPRAASVPPPVPPGLVIPPVPPIPLEQIAADPHGWIAADPPTPEPVVLPRHPPAQQLPARHRRARHRPLRHRPLRHRPAPTPHCQTSAPPAEMGSARLPTPVALGRVGGRAPHRRPRGGMVVRHPDADHRGTEPGRPRRRRGHRGGEPRPTAGGHVAAGARRRKRSGRCCRPGSVGRGGAGRGLRGPAHGLAGPDVGCPARGGRHGRGRGSRRAERSRPGTGRIHQRGERNGAQGCGGVGRPGGRRSGPRRPGHGSEGDDGRPRRVIGSGTEDGAGRPGRRDPGGRPGEARRGSTRRLGVAGLQRHGSRRRR